MHERDILLATLERHGPEEREAYLAQACGDDAQLRSRVDALLRASEVHDSFLEHPAVETEVLSRETDAIRQQCAEREELSLDFLHPTDEHEALGRLGHYEITEVIGRGGMGVVLKARDPKLNRIVAIKVLAPELASNPTARKRFQREAHAAAAVVHQHIVTIHAVDEDRLPYLVMECIVGQSLKEKIDREGHLQLIEILRIGQQVASGLSAAHAHGLIHRDVKPANILLENGVERVRITDFGLARAVDDVGMTRTGEVAGTPQYMSPEQAQGLPLDHRSDLFSFGSVLYAMCTGRPPFRAETAFATARRVCEDTPRPIREINPEIPDWLVAIIDRLLAKKPEDRFQTAAEVAGLLGQQLAQLQHPSLPGTPATAVPQSKIHNPKSKIGLRRWALAAAAIVLLLLAVSLTEATGVTQFAPTVIRIVHGEGTLVIEVADPTVQVSLDGEELSIRGAGLQEFRLTPGKYRVHATKDGRPVKDELITVARDGRKVVTITLESSGGTSSPGVAPTAEGPVGELKLLAKLDGHTDVVRTVAFLPDGRKAVSVGRDKTLRVWDLKSRSVLSVLPVEGFLANADVSTDGRVVATIWNVPGKKGIAQVWDLEKRSLLWELPQEFSSVNTARFSPDGTKLVTTGKPPGGMLWDLASGKEFQRLDLGDTLSTPMAAVFSPNGRALALGAVGRVRLFDVETGDVLGDVPLPHERHVNDLQFMATGNRLACGQASGSVSVIDVDSKQVVRSFQASDAPVVRLRLVGNDRFVLATCVDATLRICDIQRGKVSAIAATEKGTNERLAISPDGQYAITASGEDWDAASNTNKRNGDYALRLWQLPESVWLQAATTSSTKDSPDLPSVVPPAKPTPGDLTLLAKLEGHTDVVNTVAFLPDGQRMVSGSHRMVRVWDLPTRSVASTLPFEGNVLDASVSANGCLVAVLYYNVGGKLLARVWDIEKREVICEFAPEKSSNIYMRFSPDGKRVVTSSAPSPYAILWDAATGKELERFDADDFNSTPRAAFSPDGRLLALGAVGRVQVFDIESKDVVADVRLPNARGIWDLVFAPSGTALATGQAGGHIGIIALGSRRVKTLQASDATVRSVHFLGNDTFLLTCSNDATLRVWDLAQGGVVAQAATGNGTNGLFVLPDGRQVITAGGKEWDEASGSLKDHGDYALRLWQLPESVWPKASSSTSSSADTANQTPQPESGAFVLLGGKQVAERKFDTLAEAVQFASDGDTIEIRGNGPFLTNPIRRHLSLILRAGHGFRPVIRLMPDGVLADKPLLWTDSDLFLEGIVLERIAEAGTHPWNTILDSSDNASLFVANCRFVNTFGTCFRVGNVGTLRNCEFLTRPVGKGYTCNWAATAHGPGLIDNCIHSSAIAVFNPREFGKPIAKTRISRNTILGGVFQEVRALPDFATLKDQDVPLQIDASSNVFGSHVLVFQQLQTGAPSAIEAKAIVPRLLQWNEMQNVYQPDARFFAWLTTQWKPVSTIDALTNWNDWWKHTDAASVQGTVRFQGGDLQTKATLNPDQLTAADFRLRPDSAGYRAGEDGKDLGADVDLVGPGPAYERWKKTPQYQEWLEKAGQKK